MEEELVIKRMKAYASFDEYLEAQSPKNRVIIGCLRHYSGKRHSRTSLSFVTTPASRRSVSAIR